MTFPSVLVESLLCLTIAFCSEKSLHVDFGNCTVIVNVTALLLLTSQRECEISRTV